MHFRLFVGARIYHTIAYLIPLPQPNRALAFFVGYGVTFSMAYRLLKSRLYL
uniref:Microsomal glutathione S-transferase 1 n=1 Tax=Ursus americanus TaxID=9643 RepID=A0A452QJV4_URSAM